MATRFPEPEGVRDFGQRKGALDHPVAVNGVDAADQVHLIVGDADNQPLEALLASPGVITPGVLLRAGEHLAIMLA